MSKTPTHLPHTTPPDLQKMLASSKAAQATWEDITPLARNEWVCWITSVKKPETRKLHIERARENLTARKRRPCCWSDCSHRYEFARTHADASSHLR